MFLVGSWSAVSRRKVITLGVAVGLAAAVTAGTVRGQDAAAQDPHAAFRFPSGAGMVVWQIPADKMTDFESAWTEIMTKLRTSEKPEHKDFAASMKIFRPSSPSPGQPVSYFILADPASKTLPYSPVYLVFESGIFPDRPAMEAVFAKMPVQGEGVNISALPLNEVGASGGMGGGAMAPVAPGVPTTP